MAEYLMPLNYLTLDHLPQNIKELSRDRKKFQDILKKFCLAGSFYSLEEYFAWG
jgi:hypothetical protein